MTLPMKERWAVVKQQKRCPNCLKKHTLLKCPSKHSCRRCNQRHNSTLCGKNNKLGYDIRHASLSTYGPTITKDNQENNNNTGKSVKQEKWTITPHRTYSEAVTKPRNNGNTSKMSDNAKLGDIPVYPAKRVSELVFQCLAEEGFLPTKCP